MARARAQEPREYVAEMRSVIHAAIDQGKYNAALIASEIAEKLRATDPDLLHGWLDLQAEQHLREEIIKIDTVKRMAARARASKPSVFGRAATRVTEQQAAARTRGSAPEPDTEFEEFRTGWLGTRFVVDGQRHLLAEMTGTQVLQVADGYHKAAQSHLMQEAFMRAVAKKTGPNNKVSDKFTNEKLDDLWRSLSGK